LTFKNLHQTQARRQPSHGEGGHPTGVHHTSQSTGTIGSPDASHSPRLTTSKPIAAIRRITGRRRTDLDGLLRDDDGVDRPEDLSLPQASEFIDHLKAAAAV
jgi:hypothetical protein